MTKGDLVKNRETGEIGIIMSVPHKYSPAFYQVLWAWDGHTEYTHHSKLEKTND